jgi:hypothetical protein
MTLKELKDERPHWSYSSLNQLLHICALQWALERYWKVPAVGPVPVALTFGSAFHRALEYDATARLNGETAKGKDLGDLFDTLLRRQVEEDGEVDFGEDADLESTAAQGRNLVACYVAHIDPAERVLAVNHVFCVPLVLPDGTALPKPLIGEADCIVENGKRCIVDWKSGAQRYSEQKVRTSLQATAMLLGVTRTFGPVADFRFDLVVKLKKAPAFESYRTSRTENDFARLAQMAAVADKIVKAEAFCPNETGFACAGCRYKGACKSWHREASKISVRMAA